MKKNRPLKLTFAILLLSFPLLIVAKIFQYNFMGEDNFIIMDYILSYLREIDLPIDKSFAFPIQVYRLFSFLPFTTNLQWSIFWSSIVSVVLFCMLLKYRKFTIIEYIFIFANLFIIDLTVLNMNKDLIQLIIMLFIYSIIKSKFKDLTKVIIISLIFLIESLIFRSYYILIAGLILLIYFILKYFVGLSEVKKKSTIKAMFLILFFMFLGIYLMKFISYSYYDKLINRRDILSSESITAATKIIDLIPKSGYVFFILNYFLNFLRICFPVELLFKGIQYVPFIIYQIFLTINMYKLVKRSNKKNYIMVSLLLAYWLTLAASESDFGTLVRHQSILLFFYLDMLKINKGEENEEKTEFC